jgi:hypothetical protein
MYDVRHAEAMAAQEWALDENVTVSCPICMDDKKVARDVFVGTGFACLSCLDGVACRGCATQMIVRRKKGESFNTVRCPTCRRPSHTYGCLACNAPTRPGYSAKLVREMVGIDARMLAPIKLCETLDGLADEIDKILRMIHLQCRVRASFGHPIAPCLPYINNISLDLSDTGIIQTVSDVKNTVLDALRGIWPLLRWTSVIGAVCSDSDTCASKFTQCKTCNFLFRSAARSIVIDANGDAVCVVCSGQYPSLE